MGPAPAPGCPAPMSFGSAAPSSFSSNSLFGSSTGSMTFGGAAPAFGSSSTPVTFGSKVTTKHADVTEFFKPNKPANTKSDALRLTLVQNANGSFPVTEEICQILGVEMTGLLQEGAPIDPRAWVTLVCVAFLVNHYQEEKIVWELVANKTEMWLSSNFPKIGKPEKDIADNFTKSKIIVQVCSKGHRLYKVPDSMRGGQAWHCDMVTACVGGRGVDGDHQNVEVWRCPQDWRMTQGGACDYDLCGDCARTR